MALPTALLSSTGTRHRTHTVLVDQYSFGMRSSGCSSTRLLLKLLLIYGSVFVSSSLRLPPRVQVNLPWGNLSPLSPSMQRSAVKPEADSYIVPGATLLGAVLILGIRPIGCYSKPCYTSRFRFTALSSSSFIILLLLLLLLFSSALSRASA